MNDLGDQLLEGLGESIAYLRGEVVPGIRIRTVTAIPDDIDVAEIRALEPRSLP